MSGEADMFSSFGASEIDHGSQTRPPTPERACERTLATPLRELRGVVERLTYHNPENGYTVARLVPERLPLEAEAVRADDRLLTVVGPLGELMPGEAIIVHGWWRHNVRYGWQFMAVDYQTTLPATLQGLQTYLGSGLIRGVGPVMAARIVATFGEQTLTLIDADPNCLRQVPGIGPVRARRIATMWVERRHIREVMATLQEFGLSTSLAVRIYKQFGELSGTILRHVPYRLAREVWGIGFKTADTIARAVGIAPDACERLQTGMLHALSAAAEHGHTLLLEEHLVAQAADLLNIRPPRLRETLERLLESGEVVSASYKDASGRFIALLPFARAEASLASRLQTLAAIGNRSRIAQGFADASWPATFSRLAERHGLRLAPDQEAAVQMALTWPVSILRGGPGTGKTHTLRALLALARMKQLHCVLAAPTGRAASRLAEVTGHPAATLHRLLALRPGGHAGAGRDRPLAVDLVVVDEASMLDVLLANRLVRTLDPGTHLLLVGDPEQLPSVGAGEVLGNLLGSGRFPVTQLTHLFRQSAGSGIAHTAQRILAGELPRFGGSNGDCFFLRAEEPKAAAALVVDLVTQRLPAKYGFRLGDMQVLVPMYRGEAGVSALNQRLQERLNAGQEGRPEVRAGGHVYRPGDRVLQLRNDYELQLFNGDLGTVKCINPIAQELVLTLDDGREVRYPYASLFALTHAYAMSVHKAQGAEFPAVVIPLLTTQAAVLNRTLLYTAITRARQLVVIVGQPEALRLAVHDWRRKPRQTALEGLLKDALRISWPEWTIQQGGVACDIDALGWEGLLGDGDE